jgi:methyl coenzyme M reductase subunit C
MANMIYSMQIVKPKTGVIPPLRFAAVAVSLLALAACAAAPQTPNQEIQAAEMAIASAEQARVADYASPELGEAREKLTAARSAVSEKKMDVAKRLAEQSRVDAELASAKASATRAKVVNDEMLKGTDTLKQEMQRNTGESK